MDFLVHHMLRKSARCLPEKTAVVYRGMSLTYQEVFDQVSALAASFRTIGIQRGDRIGIYLDPSIELVVSIFGVSQANAVFVPINGLLLGDQVGHIAQDCEMRGLITTRKRLASLKERLPRLEFFVVVEDGSDGSHASSVFLFNDFIEKKSASALPDGCIDKDLAAILYTSGSTGKPKGVMLTHSNIVSGSSIVSAYLEITERDKILAVLPFSFDAGLNQLMTAVQQGCSLVLMTFVFAKEIVQMLVKEHITGLAGVPTMWNLLSQSNSTIQKHSFPHLRYITNTGGAMPQHVLATLRKALPKTNVYLMYGLTEAFRSTYLPPDELDRRPTSMGKAIPNTEILVVNEHNQLSKPGEVGELVHRGPTVSLGYWGNPELTAKVLRPNPFSLGKGGNEELVCYSGDLVKMDEEGFLYFVGRRDAMIKSAGYRLSRTEVEEALYESGMVKEAAVIGVPDEILGQAVTAFVVGKTPEAVNVKDILAFCSTKLPRYMVPKSIHLLEELPKTPNGKIDYTNLQTLKVTFNA
ncbi:MAG: acyl-CoA ligase (AMP-forming), exosortase A system-associated [Nitrospirales bacterium]|nr:acyl-CoA ligase (AMP-forming), exosortase A system-associated [Nitrospira sp.]MDR4501917.1 acyl-CoA ligase (AMP-forming), exosortase A system-associated [Nitrospirales bacterium]